MNKHTYPLYKKTKRKKSLYFVSNKEQSPEGSFIASHLIRTPKRISFDVRLNDKLIHLIVPASTNIEHLLPALYIANSLGMNEREIKKAVAALK